MKFLKRKPFLFLSLAFLLCLIFTVAYSTLGIVRHNNYMSYGYDLGINDQTVWRYAHFQAPVTTIDPFPDRTKLATHVELVYALISPFYWIWESRRMLLIVAAAFFCFSGIFVYLLARRKKLSYFVSLALVVSYLGFYGVQNAIWADVHSASFAAAFIMGFIYFLETKRKIPTLLFLVLSITAKENIGLLTFLIMFVYFLKNRNKYLFLLMTISAAYVAFIFLIYFPYIIHIKYLYENSGGLLSNFNPLSFADTDSKRQVIWYSLLSFGFLPLLAPLSLIPAIGDLATYFVIANELSGSQGLFGQYRITLTPLLLWSTVLAIGNYKWLNKWYIGCYLLLSTLLVQYFLHLPLSYFTKDWFWTQPAAVQTINTMIKTTLPNDASVVSQNNITPHISHRDKIYTLYPETKIFLKDSPCGQPKCNWFRWYGSPEFLIVDTSGTWDARHFLANHDEFLDGLQNIEKAGVVSKYKQIGTTILYKVNRNPAR